MYVYTCVCCFLLRSLRILSRPWHADHFLKDIVEHAAYGRGSPAQMIQHSVDLRAEMQRLSKELRPNVKGQNNLRAAKHRFESFQKPLGRTIRNFRIIHALMVGVALARSDEQGKRAKIWLEWLAATPQNILMTAMMADISDEAAALTRFCDSEAMDVAGISAAVLNFLSRATELFGTLKRCLDTIGYTKAILDDLKDPLVWVVGGKAYSLSGPTEHDIDMCLDHARGWLKLALE